MGKTGHTPGPGPVEILARVAMQREDYGRDMDLRDAVGAVLGNPIYDAAPDLLEALEEALAWGGEYEQCVPAVWADTARAAIAKARGETEEA